MRRALEGYGEYQGFRFQKFLYDDVSIYTGSRLIRMVLGVRMLLNFLAKSTLGAITVVCGIGVKQSCVKFVMKWVIRPLIVL